MIPTPARELSERARRLIVESLPDVVAIYVFGSAATGQAGPTSDLDLAVLTRRPIEPRLLYDVARSLEVALGTDVDLVDLLRASTVLKKEVIADGHLIHEADRSQVLGFESRCLSEYGRYRESVDPVRAAIRESGRAYAP
jgi:uncharacterized protein